MKHNKPIKYVPTPAMAHEANQLQAIWLYKIAPGQQVQNRNGNVAGMLLRFEYSKTGACYAVLRDTQGRTLRVKPSRLAPVSLDTLARAVK